MAGNDRYRNGENHGEGEKSPRFTVSDRRFWRGRDELQVEGGPGPQESRRLPTYLEELQQKLEEKDNKLREYIAEIKKENEEFRSRLTRDMERRVETEKLNLIKGFLAILDNLDRALDSGRRLQNPEAFRVGVQMIRDQFMNQLSINGVQRLNRRGEVFNPETDEAVEVVAATKKEEDNMILEEIEPGYVRDDYLIRPAKVRVGKYIAENSH
ncbi:MAG: nucleotide exchange factor GrpE [Nitrospinae bacterium RIFCSPLOWO2_12_FULL_45_22]|nr:MAG: nucleotide exchange factor GrpE [Nitrospinae bacterium RIFCSPLOWO2_12_FULL_45_22]